MLGATGCFAHSTGDLVSASFPVVAGRGALTLPIPANPLLTGATLTSQSVAFTLANPPNLVTSNGLLWTLGN